MGNIYFRVVEDDFSDEDGQNWMVEVVIQTTAPSDFKSFEDAVEECIDRIQERIDNEEDKEEPDHGYLEKLQEKLGDSNVEDWEEYTFSIPQPEVSVKGKLVNVAEVAGRAKCERYLKSGGELTEFDRHRLESTTSQAALGAATPKTRLKLLKDRPRPSMTFDRVKIDPKVMEVLKPVEIKGLLTGHKVAYEKQDWKATHSATLSDLSSVTHPGCFFHSLTIFMYDKTCVTFVVLVQKGEQPPDDRATMDFATADFDWNATDNHGRTSDWRPEFN